MMNLSKSVGYAVHALSCLDQAQGQPLFVQQIASQTGIPKPYLARIVNRLVHHGLIASKRGYRGGVVLACPAEQIPLLKIVEAMNAEEWSRQCFFGLDKCPSHQACPAHALWADMRGQIESKMRSTTLADVTRAIRPEEVRQALPTRPAGARSIRVLKPMHGPETPWRIDLPSAKDIPSREPVLQPVRAHFDRPRGHG
jgi:Rrf2 family transcriptional regulator, iron-sulfur cluster assembly transcription factor